MFTCTFENGKVFIRVPEDEEKTAIGIIEFFAREESKKFHAVLAGHFDICIFNDKKDENDEKICPFGVEIIKLLCKGYFLSKVEAEKMMVDKFSKVY